jgi:hypothetical protein
MIGRRLRAKPTATRSMPRAATAPRDHSGMPGAPAAEATAGVIRADAATTGGGSAAAVGRPTASAARTSSEATAGGRVGADTLRGSGAATTRGRAPGERETVGDRTVVARTAGAGRGAPRWTRLPAPTTVRPAVRVACAEATTTVGVGCSATVGAGAFADDSAGAGGDGAVGCTGGGEAGAASTGVVAMGCGVDTGAAAGAGAGAGGGSAGVRAGRNESGSR